MVRGTQPGSAGPSTRTTRTVSRQIEEVDSDGNNLSRSVSPRHPSSVIGDKRPNLAQTGATSREEVPNAPEANRAWESIEEAREWYKQTKEKEELERLQDIRRRFEQGDRSAIHETLTPSTGYQVQPFMPSIRPPTMKTPHIYHKKDRRDYNAWKDDCERCFRASAAFFVIEL